MKATHIVLTAVVLVLVACSTPAPGATAPVAAAPLAASTGAAATAPEPPAASIAPAATPSPVPALTAAPPPSTPTPFPSAAPALTEAPKAAQRAGSATVSTTPFNIGVPAGDAYYPYSAAIDPARNLAYVYHPDSIEKRPVISVVDLVGSKVVRVIRLARTGAGASGRLSITPDGRRLFLQENQDYTLSTVDVASGAVQQLLDNVRDAVVSDDGRVIYTAQADQVAAYSSADLTQGRTTAIWEAKGPYLNLVLNGDRLLAASYGTTGALASFDARTGKRVATGDTPDSFYTLAPGPNGGWAITVGGEKPSLIRYDAALNRLGDTAIIYASRLTYDAARDRYLIGGQRYSEAEPRGHPVVLSVGAGPDGKVAEQPWPGQTAPTTFVPWGKDGLVAFAEGGPAVLSVLDAATLEPQVRIPTGVRVEDLAIDDEAQILYVADDLGSIHVLKLPRGEEQAVWEGASPLALDTKNHRLYVNRPGGVVALDTSSGAVVAQFAQRGYPAPDPQADLVYIVENGVTMYDRAGKPLGTLPSTFPVVRGFVPNPSAYAAHVNPVTGHVAVVMNNGVPGSNGGSYLRIYPRQSDKPVEPSAPHSFVMDVAADRQGNWYVAYSTVRNQEMVQVLSADGKEFRRLDRRTGYMALDEANDRLYLFLYGRVTRLAASTLAPLEVFQGPELPQLLAFSPAAHAVFLAGGNSPLVTPLVLGDLSPLDLRPAPGRPSTEAANESLVVLADRGKRLLVGRFGQAYTSPDGSAWERLLPGTDMLFGYVTAANPRTLFATGVSSAGGEGVWRSTDGGETWEWLVAGLADLAPQGPVLALGPDQAYFLNRGQGLLRWNAPAGKWESVSKPDRDGEWGPISLAPDGTLFRSDDDNLERSTDGGATWTKLGASGKTGAVIGYSSLYTVTHTIFSVVTSSYRITGLQRSTDGGMTWEASNTGSYVDFDGYRPEVDTGFGRTYLLLRPYSGEPNLLRTTDYGDTWQVAPAGTVTGVDHLAVDPLDGRLWLGVKGGVRTVDPEKLTWAKVTAAATTAPRATPTPKPPTATATAGPCKESLTGNDAEINGRGLGLGCPKGPAESIQMARQRFQNGQMIWRQDVPQIYVLTNDGRWTGYRDTWIEGDPADDPSLTPPAGLQQPVRGFGKVWRQQLGGPKAPIGWALEKEAGVLGEAQAWDHGTVLRFGGEAIVLFDRGQWK